MTHEPYRRTPEELLRQAQAEERAATKGYLKIFLGYSSGVGKSFRMLDEARRRAERGQDVVVGAAQPASSPEVAALLAGLEALPLREFAGGAAVDVDALIRRRPAVCFIDSLAYDNPPGARNRTRWQDVQELLDHGINVVTSINIQYIAEYRERAEAITGKRVAVTAPEAFIRSAGEIELVDAPAPEPSARSAEPAAAAKSQQSVSKLRELALVLAADVVDRQLGDYMARLGINQQFGAQERVMICVTPRANISEMLTAARIMAERFHADLTAAYVHQPQLEPAYQRALDEKLEAARDAGARIEILDGEDPVDLLLDFARSRGITQLFIGHSQRRGIRARLLGNPVDRLIRESRGMDVRVFPQ